jgi:hypothetical protein
VRESRQRYYRLYSEKGFTEDDIKKIGSIKGIDAATRYLSVNLDIKGKKKYTQRIVIYYRFVGYLELPSSEGENYKANTRKGVDVEYIPTAKSA